MSEKISSSTQETDPIHVFEQEFKEKQDTPSSITTFSLFLLAFNILALLVHFVLNFGASVLFYINLDIKIPNSPINFKLTDFNIIPSMLILDSIGALFIVRRYLLLGFEIIMLSTFGTALLFLFSLLHMFGNTNALSLVKYSFIALLVIFWKFFILRHLLATQNKIPKTIPPTISNKHSFDQSIF